MTDKTRLVSVNRLALNIQYIRAQKCCNLLLTFKICHMYLELVIKLDNCLASNVKDCE